MATAKKGKGFDASYLTGITQNASKSTVLSEQATEAQQQIEADIQQAVTEGRIIWFDITLLENNPNQPPGRVVIDDDLRTLSNDMRINGFLTEYAIPTRISPNDPIRRQMVSGHRRTAAAQLAELTLVPIIVKDYTDLQMLLLNLKENLFRVQLSPLDEAFSYSAMLKVLDPVTEKRLYTQEKIAEEIGKSRGYVRNRLALLDMPTDVQAMLRQDPETVRAAYYLQDIEDEALRAQVIAALLTHEITGERVPGYVQVWRERQAQEHLRQTEPASETPEPNTNEFPDDISEPDQKTSIPALPIVHTNGEPPFVEVESPSTPPVQSQTSPTTTLMQSGDQRSKELLALNQLRTIKKKLTEYAQQRGSRTPSQDEQDLLQEIIRYGDELKKEG